MTGSDVWRTDEVGVGAVGQDKQRQRGQKGSHCGRPCKGAWSRALAMEEERQGLRPECYLQTEIHTPCLQLNVGVRKRETRVTVDSDGGASPKGYWSVLMALGPFPQLLFLL